jgi:hypothetical protein
MPTTNGWVRAAACSGGNCVELGDCGDHILIRNSETDQEPLHFTRKDIEAFIAGVKAGDFDRFLGGEVA